MQPLYMKPKPGVITPDGMPSECVIDTHAPSRSMTDMWVVSLFARPALKRGTLAFCPVLIAAASWAA